MDASTSPTEAPVATKGVPEGSVSYDSTMTNFAAEEASKAVDISSPGNTPQKNRREPEDAGKAVLEAIDRLVDQVRAAEEHKARLAHLGDTLGPELTPKLEQKVRRKSKVRLQRPFRTDGVARRRASPPRAP